MVLGLLWLLGSGPMALRFLYWCKSAQIHGFGKSWSFMLLQSTVSSQVAIMIVYFFLYILVVLKSLYYLYHINNILTDTNSILIACQSQILGVNRSFLGQLRQTLPSQATFEPRSEISELRGDVSGSVARLRRCDTFRLPFRGSGANLQSADITMGNIEK